MDDHFSIIDFSKDDPHRVKTREQIHQQVVRDTDKAIKSIRPQLWRDMAELRKQRLGQSSG